MKRKKWLLSVLAICMLVGVAYAWTLLLDENGNPVEVWTHGGTTFSFWEPIQLDGSRTYQAHVAECQANAKGEILIYKSDESSVVVLDRWVPQGTTGDYEFTTPAGDPKTWMLQVTNTGQSGENDRMIVQLQKQ